VVGYLRHEHPCPSETPFVFPGRNRNREVGRGRVREWIASIVKLAGMTRRMDDAGRIVRFNPHTFRSYLVGDLIARGVGDEDVARVLGHADFATTEKHYWKPTRDEVEAQIVWPFDNPPGCGGNGV